MGAVLVVNAGSTSLKLHVVSDAEDVAEVESLDAVRSDDIGAVGHRVVHGGSHLIEATVIDDAVRASVAELESIAPLHNRPALAGIDAATRAFPAVPHVAVFDTAFHATMPTRLRPTRFPEPGARSGGFGASASTGSPCNGARREFERSSSARSCVSWSVTWAVAVP